jgi:hypothetical protein
MKIYEILGMSRSGHHTVVNWVIKNTMGIQCDWNYKLTQLGSNGLFFLNEANHDIPLSFEYLREKKGIIKKLYLNYEDTPGDYTLFNNENEFRGPLSISIDGFTDTEFSGRVIVLRDFYNLLVSRIKLNENKKSGNWVGDRDFILEVGEKFIFRWKSQVRACLYNNIPYLKFEDWLNNNKVREKFLYENFGLRDIYGIKNIRGTTSSFGSHDNVNNRFEQYQLPEDLKELIKKDTELHFLMGAIGYQYKEI